MNKTGWLGLGIASLCVACGGSGESSSSTGGGGAGTGGATSSGGTTSTTSAGGTTSSGGAGGTAGSGPMENVYDNAVADLADLAPCTPVAPLPEEDGTFAVTIFGPFPKAFTIDGFTFVVAEGGNLGITDPWMASVVVVPAGGDPLAVDPGADAKDRMFTVLDSVVDGTTTVKQLSVTLDAPVAVAASERVVVSLRNTVGPPLSAILMCGASAHQENNQWWNLDGTMTQMSTYGADFDHDWWVSLVPAAN